MTDFAKLLREKESNLKFSDSISPQIAQLSEENQKLRSELTNYQQRLQVIEKENYRSIVEKSALEFKFDQVSKERNELFNITKEEIKTVSKSETSLSEQVFSEFLSADPTLQQKKQEFKKLGLTEIHAEELILAIETRKLQKTIQQRKKQRHRIDDVPKFGVKGTEISPFFRQYLGSGSFGEVFQVY